MRRLVILMILIFLVGCNKDYAVDAIAHPVYIPVKNRVAEYIKDDSPSINLKKDLGELYAETEEYDWYKLENVNNIEYLIQKTEDGILTLWHFDSFLTEDASDQVKEGFPYAEFDAWSYGEEMLYVYNVDCAESIDSITVRAASHGDVEKLNEITDEIETFEIEDQDEIEYLYDVLSDRKCFGYGSEFRIHFRTPEIQAEIEADQDNEYYYMRELEIHLKDGASIKGLNYSSASGVFFKYLEYEPVDEDTAVNLDAILKISF